MTGAWMAGRKAFLWIDMWAATMAARTVEPSAVRSALQKAAAKACRLAEKTAVRSACFLAAQTAQL
jgi:hypothetical protein